jgi:SAM-dependent methyltransferase
MAVKPFGDYAECYAALYQDKDYAGEARFVSRVLRQFGAGKAALLEFGCGTGAYTRLFARDHDRIVGVDSSAAMLRQAAFLTRGPSGLAKKISYRRGDLRSLRLPGRFDVVLSLFHVMSYQTENADLARAFASASRHLKKGGLFLFDFWHGPGVLHTPPERRVKRAETADLRVVRTALPLLDPTRNTVRVTFDIALRRKATGRSRRFREEHLMRYLFKPEVLDLCARTGLELLEFGEWRTGRPPGLASWLAYAVARKTG